MTNLSAALSIAVMVWSMPATMAADDFAPRTFFTGNYAPFNYVENNELRGMSAELLSKVFRPAKSAKTLKDGKVVPSARGYKFAQQKKNTVLFSKTRTKAREKLFTCVVAITSTVISLIAKQGGAQTVTSAKDLEGYTIGTV